MTVELGTPSAIAGACYLAYLASTTGTTIVAGACIVMASALVGVVVWRG